MMNECVKNRAKKKRKQEREAKLVRTCVATEKRRNVCATVTKSYAVLSPHHICLYVRYVVIYEQSMDFRILIQILHKFQDKWLYNCCNLLKEV